ncbi:M23 family metallopeptidase [Prauserella rugosa]|uniref:Peptidase M23-like protein n=1 Tax=Prauserella rugosa TaxID=43354 RepID=A0A660CKZ6_9PSEU|nr:M23 family metallopeptidase [Prauserella rugosa]KMS91109.1 peptidase [Streptomyces regensis]TWH22303.1 peptidase M23-like protein [Prauserella rugosa]
MVAAVAAGAFAAAAAGQTLQNTSSNEAQSGAVDTSTDVTPLANTHDASAAMGMGGDAPVSAPQLLQVREPADENSSASAEAQKINRSAELTDARLAAEAEARRQAAIEAARPKVVQPAEGTFTSGFGARWGTTHYGIDLANSIGTPIVSAVDGTVIEAGPASGFGQWVKVQRDDGIVTVYGHVSSFSVSEGERVKAGDEIALMGNEGQSTGPHLHFEVWTSDGGEKIDPLPWLAEHGVHIS